MRIFLFQSIKKTPLYLHALPLCKLYMIECPEISTPKTVFFQIRLGRRTARRKTPNYLTISGGGTVRKTPASTARRKIAGINHCSAASLAVTLVKSQIANTLSTSQMLYHKLAESV